MSTRPSFSDSYTATSWYGVDTVNIRDDIAYSARQSSSGFFSTIVRGERQCRQPGVINCCKCNGTGGNTSCKADRQAPWSTTSAARTGKIKNSDQRLQPSAGPGSADAGLVDPAGNSAPEALRALAGTRTSSWVPGIAPAGTRTLSVATIGSTSAPSCGSGSSSSPGAASTCSGRCNLELQERSRQVQNSNAKTDQCLVGHAPLQQPEQSQPLALALALALSLALLPTWRPGVAGARVVDLTPPVSTPPRLLA